MRKAIAVKPELILVLWATAVTSTQAADLFGQWKWELGAYGGGLIADKEVSRDINATGGEQLMGRLATGGIFGGRVGLHSDLLGLDLGGAVGSEQIEVRNEFGVDFPNHGSNPVLLSGDIFIYPLGRSLLEGGLKPYATGGIGFSRFSIDSDNVRGQETYTPLTWNYGAGVKFYFYPNEDSMFLDLGFRNYRVSSTGAIRAFDMQAVTIGVGLRF